MKLMLIEVLGRGLLTDYKKEIGERVDIDVGRDGFLMIGPVSVKTKSGKASIPQHRLPSGKNKIVFSTPDGMKYSCGSIVRSGRLISVLNPTDDIVCGIIPVINAMQNKIDELEAKIKDADETRGIKII